MNARLNVLLTVLLVLSALSLVNSQYQARRLFIELERAQATARQLDIEWAQLQLDQSTLGKHARIEANARRDLKMVALTPARTQYLTAVAEMSPQSMKAPRLPSPPTPASRPTDGLAGPSGSSGAKLALQNPASAPQAGEGNEASRFAISALSRGTK
jgi:cell division protein FtsL